MFNEHLRDLLNVINALDGDVLSDLIQFQLFIHHRAYRKLAWRVRDFRTRWGGLPFDIISKNLDRNLERKNVELRYKNAEFHNFIQDYVDPVPVSPIQQTQIGYMYSVDAENALQWLEALRKLWRQLEAILLDEEFAVKEESPEPLQVNVIVSTLFFFESLVPVLIHILSSAVTARALGDAGEFEGPLTSYCSNIKLLEMKVYHERLMKTHNAAVVVGNPDISVDEDLKVVLPNDDLGESANLSRF